MKKFRKLICCIVMPILAVVGLAGCGNDRNALTIQNRYTQMIQDNKDMFLRELDKNGNEMETFSVKIGVSYESSEMKKLEEIDKWETYNDNFVTDNNLYVRYYALKNLQGKILDNVFEYYKQQKDLFFSNFDELDMEKKERKQLYNNIEELEEAVETFKVARDKINNTADVLTFNGIVRADITAYAYDYNMLIEKCIEFVRYFKELNIKYYYSSEISDVNYQEYLKQYIDEAIFELNEIAYYKFVKSSNSVNECDLSKTYVVSNKSTFKVSCRYVNAENDSMWGMDKLDEMIGKVNKFDGSDYLYTQSTLKKIAEFEEVREVFLQKFRVYKTVYENMDYYKYNQAFLSDELEEYKQDVTNIENANIDLVEDFYNVAVVDYMESIDAFMSQE